MLFEFEFKFLWPGLRRWHGRKKHQNGKPRVSSKNLVFWDEPYVFVVFGGTRMHKVYIYILGVGRGTEPPGLPGSKG